MSEINQTKFRYKSVHRKL